MNHTASGPRLTRNESLQALFGKKNKKILVLAVGFGMLCAPSEIRTLEVSVSILTKKSSDYPGKHRCRHTVNKALLLYIRRVCVFPEMREMDNCPPVVLALNSSLTLYLSCPVPTTFAKNILSLVL